MSTRAFRIDPPPGAPVEISVDGRPLTAYPGESIAAALLAAGQPVFRRAPHSGAARGMFCGIGVCFECLVTVNGVRGVRACVTPVQPGMVIWTRSPEGLE